MKNKILQLFKYLGPAFLISVAYIDPGNFATNIKGGSMFNYSLLWIILWSNLMAIFLQSMSAKLGIATGYNLPQLCGKTFSRKTNWFLLITAEISAIATDLAEFLGCTLGLYLLFKIPMPIAGIITACITLLILYFGKYGQRTIEVIIIILITVICAAYTFEIFLSKPNFSMALIGTLKPFLPNTDAIFIAVGMLGATVMPHVIYLHSELVQCRNNHETFEEKSTHLNLEKLDIFIAMNIAFLVNAAMVIVSAAVFYKMGIVVETIEQAHHSLSPLLGNFSSSAFGLALFASGLSSSVVGTMAGQTIMQGFVNLNISDNLTRLITLIPGMIIIVIGINPMQALILSQVILSFSLPFAIIPMLIISSRRDLMGDFVNKPATNVTGWVITLLIIILNIILILSSFI
jgi:manganese transport protein